MRPCCENRSYWLAPRCRSRRFMYTLFSAGVECFRRGLRHQIEPVGMLGGRAVVRPIVFGHVQTLLVAIDDERDFGNVAIVQPIAGDAPFGRPASQVPCPGRKSPGEQLRLLVRSSPSARQKPASGCGRGLEFWRLKSSGGRGNRRRARSIRPTFLAHLIPVLSRRFLPNGFRIRMSPGLQVDLVSKPSAYSPLLFGWAHAQASGHETGNRYTQCGRCRAYGDGRRGGPPATRNQQRRSTRSATTS